jgi:histidinol-phosphate aminotransferase
MTIPTTLPKTTQARVDSTIRADVRAMTRYPVADASGYIKLDAMENPYTLPPALQAELGKRLADVLINRYPVPDYKALKASVCAKLGVPDGFDVMLGNGSDEIIAIIIQSIAGGTVLCPSPSFVMFEINAKLNRSAFVGVPLQADFSLDMPAMRKAIADHQPKLIFLVNPNNPTGNLFADEQIEEIVRLAPGLVVVDEAYVPFAQHTWMPKLAQFPQLAVMRTVSKIGLAGIRLGYVAAGEHWLDEFEKVRPPYNLNVLTEEAAKFALDHLDVLDEQTAIMRQQRDVLSAELRKIDSLQVFPSMANFVLVRAKNGPALSAALKADKILVRDCDKMHTALANCLRLSVGTPEQNQIMLAALRQYA